MKKRFLAGFLSAVMIAACMPPTVFAENEDGSIEIIETEASITDDDVFYETEAPESEEAEVLSEHESVNEEDNKQPEKTPEEQTAQEETEFKTAASYTYIKNATFVGHLTMRDYSSLGAYVYEFITSDGDTVDTYASDSFDIEFGEYYIVTTNSNGRIIEISEFPVIEEPRSVGFFVSYYSSWYTDYGSVKIVTADGEKSYELARRFDYFDIESTYSGAVIYTLTDDGRISRLMKAEPIETYHNIEYDAAGFAELKYPCGDNTKYLYYYETSLTPGEYYTVEVYGYGSDLTSAYIAIWPVGKINNNISYELTLGIFYMSGSGKLTEDDNDSLQSIFNDSYIQVERLVIGEGITELNGIDLHNVTADDITIGSEVSKIENTRFSPNTNITVAEDNKDYCSVNGTLFNKSMTELIHFGSDSIETYEEKDGNTISYYNTYTIPDTVTTIADYAFCNAARFEKLIFPSNIEKIGNYAFQYVSIRNIEFTGNALKTIGDYAFYYNRAVQSLSLPDGLTSICSYAFYYCENLNNLNLPDSLTIIDDNAFSDCKSLTSINLPDSLTTIGNHAFSYCSGLTSVSLPNGIASLVSVFEDCSSLTSIVIPESVTELRDFSSCDSLTSITIPEGVSSLGGFRGCAGLTSLTIPKSVTKINDYSFQNCKGLTSLTLENGAVTMSTYGDYICPFSGCDNIGEVTINSGDCNLSWLEYLKGLKKIIIGSAVKGIKNLPSGVEIEIDEKNEYLLLEDGIIYNSDKTELICGAGAEGSFVIPDGITSIGNSAFSGCTGLTSVTIPDSVTSIGDSAFQDCSGLTSVTIPDSVTSIGNSAFFGCTGLTDITIPDSVTSIGNYTFYSCTELTSVDIPDSVTSVGYGIFIDCSSLSHISIGSGVSEFGFMLYNDSALEAVSVSENNESLSSEDGVVFNKNKTILIKYPPKKRDTQYTIPDSITSIGVLKEVQENGLKPRFLRQTQTML